jgi:hypothetical protein
MQARPGLLFASLCLAGCSLLAPSDDELLGGGSTGGTTSSGGGGGGGSGGSAGTPSGGGTAGSAGVTGGGGAPTGGGGSTGGGGAPTGGGGKPSGGGGAPTGGGGAPTGGGGAPTGGGGAPTGGGGSGGSTCQPSNGDATALPRAVYLLLDRSSSMADGGKFSSAVSGINSFATGSKASGVDAGLQYFGLDTGGSCSGVGYGSPVVGFGLLPALSQAISASLAGTSTGGATPLEGVLNGGKNAGTTYLASKPGRQVDVVIITDVTQITNGGGCSSNTATFAAIVASGWPSMATHFLAMPNATKSMLDGLASAGGTAVAESVSSSFSISSALERAITPCRFAIPSGHTASQLSLTLAGQKLTRVNTPIACGFGDGWFEHAGAAVLCPESCQTLSGGGKVTFTASCG